MVGDRHRCACGTERELASELGEKLCHWRERRPLMVAGVQLGVSERAVPAMPHSVPVLLPGWLPEAQTLHLAPRQSIGAHVQAALAQGPLQGPAFGSQKEAGRLS